MLDGILVQQSSAWWLRVDGQPTLFGPVQNNSKAAPGDRVAVVVAQQGTMYVVFPGDGAGGTTTGADKNYVHTQAAAAVTWTVVHGLGKFPAVSVVDSGGNVLIPNVQYVDANTLTVTFAAATSGKVYVN